MLLNCNAPSWHEKKVANSKLSWKTPDYQEIAPNHPEVAPYNTSSSSSGNIPHRRGICPFLARTLYRSGTKLLPPIPVKIL